MTSSYTELYSLTARFIDAERRAYWVDHLMMKRVLVNNESAVWRVGEHASHSFNHATICPWHVSTDAIPQDLRVRNWTLSVTFNTQAFKHSFASDPDRKLIFKQHTCSSAGVMSLLS